jgi:hypothetical protein
MSTPQSNDLASLMYFYRHIELGDNGCWNWTGNIMKNGYGLASVGMR